jgi:hypothetical protein
MIMMERDEEVSAALLSVTTRALSCDGYEQAA